MEKDKKMKKDDKKEKKEKKQFQAESKKLLDLMIHSIYTNKEIFLRELLSNASDAIDKLYYRSLTDNSISVQKEELEIRIDIDKEKRKLIIRDNGCGMTKEELETNLGTIAKSGSLAFKEQNKSQDIDIIGQFGVGFYSAFMVSDKIKVESKAIGAEDAYEWKSEGADGYTISKCKKDTVGTTITLKIKEDTEEEKYSEFLDSFRIQGIVKKYSDYIRYPIKMQIEHSKLKEGTENEYEKEMVEETINSMVPLWKKSKSEITEEEYQDFYSMKFFDYDKPLKTIHTSVEGQCSYQALLYIPSHLPYDFYTKEYEKGLQLYSSGVLIMDKCSDLLPDYFSFVKGLVDTEDVSLNISREILQQNHSVQLIAKSIEKKIKKELETMLKEDREVYENFFKTFGMQIKFGVYADYGVHKDDLKDLLMFYSSTEKKLVTLEEYVSRMKEGQENIYYACGENNDKVDNMPQVEMIKEKGYEILYLTEYVDEFALQTLTTYNAKKFVNVSNDTVDLDTEEEKEELSKVNEESKDMFEIMKKVLEDTHITDIKFTHRLKNHPVCLTTEGELSASMQKVLNALPNENQVNAKMVLEINAKHPISKKLKKLYETNKEELENYTKVLYSEARLIEGLPIENPTEISNLICDMISRDQENDMKKIWKRILAYLIDMMVVLIIVQSISGISVVNRQLDDYNRYYKEYTKLVEEYTGFKSELVSDFKNKKLSEKEYHSLIEDYPTYQESLETFYQDQELTEDEYQKVIDAIDKDYESEYKRLYYQIEKNSVTYFVLYLIVVLVYFVGFNKVTNGQTLGKKLMRLQVVNCDDSKKVVPIWSYFVRTLILYQPIYYLTKLIGIFTLKMNAYYQVTSIVYDVHYYLEFIVLLTVMIRLDGRGIHDLLARTRVALFDKNGNEIEEQSISCVAKKLDSRESKSKKIVDEDSEEGSK